MALMLESPSRIWRRIEADDGRDMPSLPSLPLLDDSTDNVHLQESSDSIGDTDESLNEIASPLHSTPAISSHQTTRTFRGGASLASMGTSSNTGSAARFANSIARSSRSSIPLSRFGSVGGASLNSKHDQEPPELDSFDISAIPSLPDAAGQGSDIEVDSMDDLSDALESVSRTNSPYPGPIEPSEGTPGNKTKYFEYDISLKSEPKPSPFSKDKFRHIVTRRPALERTRTPSLTRTTLSPVSSPPTTPQSHRSDGSLRANSVGSPSESSHRSASPTALSPASIPLPRPNTSSPAVDDVQNANSPEAELDERQRTCLLSESDRDIEDTASMDITDAHISPVRQFGVEDSEHSKNPNEGEEEDSSRDPTFTSSEGDGATPYPQRTTSPRGGMGAFSGLRDEMSAFSSASLSPSVALATPTPALPRPRFVASATPKDLQGAPWPRAAATIRAAVKDDSTGSGSDGHAHEDSPIEVAEWGTTETPKPQIHHVDEEDHLEAVDGDYDLTPHTRRKSFLLSVIHSTARPRPRLNKFTTPRPRQGPGNFEQRLLRNRGRDSIGSVVDQIETPAPSASKVAVRFSEAIEDSPGPKTPAIQIPSVAPTPGLRTAFAGVTPRPRFLKGSSHPISQTHAADLSITSAGANDVKHGSPAIEVTSESGIKDTILSPGRVEGEGTAVRPWGTQAPIPEKNPSPFNKSSPYLASSSDTSLVSTASSHDLTAHPRANTSFDPALGFGGRTGTTAHGVGRFNANKLNNYLHGLNRRLQEENEKLVERLRRAEKQRKENIFPATSDISASFSGVERGRRRSSGARRRISAGSALDDVKEEEENEQRDYAAWTEEKAELEAIIDAFKAEIDARALEKGVLERAVEVERAGFAAEKEEMERMIEEARKDAELLAEEKDGLAKKNEEMARVLEEEVCERARDKERWKERMGEVERGVESIVHDLEKKLESENQARKAQAELERRIADTMTERDEALEREKKAVAALDAGAELGGELQEANERLGRLMGQLRRANGRVEEVENLLSEADERVEKMEQKARDLDALKEASVAERKEAEAQLDQVRREVDAKKVEVRHLEDLNMRMEEELKGTKAYVNELEESAAAAIEQIQEKERELREAAEKIQHMDYASRDLEDQLEDAEKDKEATKELARQLEEALEAAERKMETDEEELVKLQGRITTLEQDKERQKDLSSRSMDLSQVPLPDAKDAAAENEALEEELYDANKEIARLNTILNQSPARKAMDKAKDVRIEMLEKENEGLAERIKAMRITMNDFTMNTPGRSANYSNISPIHRQVLAMALKTPKTPGGPLRDMSWLNTTFGGDSSVAPLVAELSRLQRQLDRANESIDDKLDKLEDAGLGVVELTEKLENARFRIRALEDELSRLKRAEELRVQRLQRVRCKKCLTKVDVGSLAQLSRHEDENLFNSSKDDLPSEPPTPPTRTSEALKANLRSVNDQLAQMKKQWDDEKRQLQGDKDVLQDAADRLNIQIRETREEVNRASERQKADSHLRQDLQSEIDKAKRTISSLEENLKIERARIRSMAAEQNRIAQEKDGVLSQLQTTETDMENVKQQLLTYKKENREMENELRVNANAEQRVRLLESKVKENTETMEQLREERALLVVEHKELQRKFTKISEQTQRLREQEASTKQTHENHRQQLDLHIDEINELRKALSDRAEELHRAEAEKKRLAVEGNGVTQTVAALESDLWRVKKDAEAFGRDLKLLRAEKEKLEIKHREETSRTERVKKQLQTQMKLLGEQLDEEKNKTAQARSELDNHTCAVDENQLTNLKLQHNKECKGLIVQIRYLKAKFTRESVLRYDLAYQKQYLLILLAKFEKSELTIFAAISKIGFPVLPAPQPKKRKKLKSVAFTVVFLTRLSRLSEEWRKQSASKQAIAAALQDVRQRRTTAVT
ncbi:hypothetical protein E1B28_007744 [Marasmius oreades]|uniref:Pericentrin/AKAP-450 centrosomal targeting domain-containing protein n=1 Tax=Marasmius oreades TaxID=181124 RepID=A0A9P7S2Z6_9AGAR|nr:uncharacterized protein E1B28_007744 [Marasmius oreades]KAG7094132.1 hypothetical protein E1B28_007744 [Marasmius oreades]